MTVSPSTSGPAAAGAEHAESGPADETVASCWTAGPAPGGPDPDPGLAPDPGPGPGPRAVVASGRWSAPALTGLVVALACALFVFVQMRPDLLFADTTPAGGDMGAHVWGPAYLRDHLLTQGRLSGWTPDWYAGFPAYQFYMVIPSLAIVALNAGFGLIIGIPLALLLIGAALWATTVGPLARAGAEGPVADLPGRILDRLRTVGGRRAVRIGAVVAAVLVVSLPYGISFKLVSVAGLVAFPVTAWAMARLARCPEPVPAFVALGATVFLFDTNFSITGGNIASTLAGEFAFSISLALTLLAIGLVARGMDTGRGRARAAVVVALVALCHIIPVFFAIVALVALVALAPGIARLWPVAVAIGLSLVPVAMAEGTSTGVSILSLAAAVAVLGAVIVTEPGVRARATWLIVVGPTAVLLSAFWLLPFVGREPYFNDMGWERLTEYGPKMLTVPMRLALPVAAIGLLFSLASRDRIGLVFSTTGVVAAAAVVNLPAGALWNERLLPFYYLSVYIVAGVGLAHVARFAATAMSEDYLRPHARTVMAASVAGLLATLVAVGVPLRVLPFEQVQADGSYRYLVFTSKERSFLPSWTAWNYSGYERKPAYREYHGIVTEMARLGDGNGCGRAMWEYSKNLDRYGTPMALMLLPHWTDGCIGSMEGLYFESSATTPFHFLNQSMLSDEPSRAQRDLPYQSFDIQRGIDQLQVMGVRYYLAQSDAAITAARASDQLTEVGGAEPFVVFEVAGSELVQGLSYQPVVTSGQSEEEAGEAATKFDTGWLGQAVRYYNDPEGFNALPAEDGPQEWERVTTLLPTDGEAVEAAEVSAIETTSSTISFRVDQVGQPVLIKASYFPNWNVDGAEGPWRVGPNLMAVVPTENEVTLSYGRTGLDYLALLLSAAGLAGVVALARRDRRIVAAMAGGPPDQGPGSQPSGVWPAARSAGFLARWRGDRTGVGTTDGVGPGDGRPGDDNHGHDNHGHDNHGHGVEAVDVADAGTGTVDVADAGTGTVDVSGNGHDGHGDEVAHVGGAGTATVDASGNGHDDAGPAVPTAGGSADPGQDKPLTS